MMKVFKSLMAMMLIALIAMALQVNTLDANDQTHDMGHDSSNELAAVVAQNAGGETVTNESSSGVADAKNVSKRKTRARPKPKPRPRKTGPKRIPPIRVPRDPQHPYPYPYPFPRQKPAPEPRVPQCGPWHKSSCDNRFPSSRKPNKFIFDDDIFIDWGW